MAFLKYFIYSILASVSLEGGEGWFPVEKREIAQDFSKGDPSIWILFSKDLGPGQFSVRFPEDPTYRYIGEGELEVVSKRGEEIYTLQVLRQEPPEQVGQKVIHANDRVFVFTANVDDGKTLEKIVSSLQVQ